VRTGGGRVSLRRMALTKLPARDAARFAGTVLAPLLIQGVLKRRPTMVELAQRLDTDGRAVATIQDLRRRHGDGPLLIEVPGRRLLLPLTAADVERVLAGSPEPFTPANREKRSALVHFQPDGVLISDHAHRPDRRRFNEAVLETGRPVHSHADRFGTVVREEVDAMLAAAGRDLTWKADFEKPWWRIVRRVVLGDSAAADDEVLDTLTRLRREANWAFAWPTRKGLRTDLLRRLEGYVERAEPGSLAALVKRTPAGPGTDGPGQLPQWLFAFDGTGMAAFRVLALLGTHGEEQRRARAEAATLDGDAVGELPFLRACLHESVRLWPTTPIILRDTTTELSWDGGTVPAGTAVAVLAPFLHRDDATLPHADRFVPDIWLDGRATESWQHVPFSAGPAVCPGRDLALLLTSTLLARVLRDRSVSLQHAGRRPEPGRPLPGTLNPFTLRIGLERVPAPAPGA